MESSCGGRILLCWWSRVKWRFDDMVEYIVVMVGLS